jgi:hypothetical protein
MRRAALKLAHAITGDTYLWKGQVSRIRVSARSSVKDQACSLKGG